MVHCRFTSLLLIFQKIQKANYPFNLKNNNESFENNIDQAYNMQTRMH